MIKGHNLDNAYEHALHHALEFFSKAGSLFVMGPRGRKPYAPYGGEHAETSALALFQAVWAVDYTDARIEAMKLLFWLRDCRGGAGNRSGFRSCIRWLAADAGVEGREWLRANMFRIPAHGRMDDLESLFGTPLEEDAAKLWVAGIRAADHFALKWAKRNMKPLQKVLGVNEAGLRKLLAQPERHTVEQHMCSNLSKCPKCKKLTHWHKPGAAKPSKENPWDGMSTKTVSSDSGVYVCAACGFQQNGPIQWETIEYKKIPSKAMKAYAKAFAKHDTEGFTTFKDDLKAGKTKVNAAVLFPHDCKHAVDHGDRDIADAQFEALPNFMAGNNMRIMALVDTSGSMGSAVAGGTVMRIDVSVSLGLYCSDRLGPDNLMYRKYMEFSSVPSFKDWRGQQFSYACQQNDGWCGSTNIKDALDYLLAFALKNKIPEDKMINCLLILSDMQFDQGCEGTDHTVVENCMKKWQAAGYEVPRIVYWNLAGYAGQPATAKTPNTALVSGFSPSVMKAILSGEDFSPIAIMRRAISKYEVSAPATKSR